VQPPSTLLAADLIREIERPCLLKNCIEKVAVHYYIQTSLVTTGGRGGVRRGEGDSKKDSKNQTAAKNRGEN